MRVHAAQRKHSELEAAGCRRL